jgi:hypothetical protein
MENATNAAIISASMICGTKPNYPSTFKNLALPKCDDQKCSLIPADADLGISIKPMMDYVSLSISGDILVVGGQRIIIEHSFLIGPRDYDRAMKVLYLFDKIRNLG